MKKNIFVLACLLSVPYAIAMERVDISGLDKKVLLNALYQRAQPLGMGFMHYKPNHILSDVEMDSILSRGGDTDYVHGRVMKINVSSDSVNTYLYNRDNGENAAESVIESLRHKTEK